MWKEGGCGKSDGVEGGCGRREGVEGGERECKGRRVEGTGRGRVVAVRKESGEGGKVEEGGRGGERACGGEAVILKRERHH